MSHIVPKNSLALLSVFTRKILVYLIILRDSFEFEYIIRTDILYEFLSTYETSKIVQNVPFVIFHKIYFTERTRHSRSINPTGSILVWHRYKQYNNWRSTRLPRHSPHTIAMELRSKQLIRGVFCELAGNSRNSNSEQLINESLACIGVWRGRLQTEFLEFSGCHTEKFISLAKYLFADAHAPTKSHLRSILCGLYLDLDCLLKAISGLEMRYSYN